MVKNRGPSHFIRCSQLEHALKTSSLGALNWRLMTISLSPTGDDEKVELRLTAIFLLLVFQFFKIGVQPIETLFPKTAIPVDEVRYFLQRPRFQPARPPLRLTPLSN